MWKDLHNSEPIFSELPTYDVPKSGMGSRPIQSANKPTEFSVTE